MAPDTTGQPQATGRDGTGHDDATDATGQDIETVARELGVTPDAVRKRIARGQLAAWKSGGRWLVAWPAGGPDTNGTGHPTQQDQNGTRHAGATGRDPDRTGQDRLLALVEALTARTERLENERAELYGRLGYMQAQLAAKDEQIKALEAPKEPIAPPPPAGAIFRPLPAEPDPPRRPWWRFW